MVAEVAEIVTAQTPVARVVWAVAVQVKAWRTAILQRRTLVAVAVVDG